MKEGAKEKKMITWSTKGLWQCLTSIHDKKITEESGNRPGIQTKQHYWIEGNWNFPQNPEWDKTPSTLTQYRAWSVGYAIRKEKGKRNTNRKVKWSLFLDMCYT